MIRCLHLRGDLRCTLAAGHRFGHVYQSTSGVAHCEKEEMV